MAPAGKGSTCRACRISTRTESACTTGSTDRPRARSWSCRILWERRSRCGVHRWRLSSRAFEFCGTDTRGHGSSSVPAGEYAVDDLGRDLVALLDHLELSRVSLCGLSLGGLVAMWMGIHAKDRLERLVLANTAAYLGPPENWQARIDLVREQGTAALAEVAPTRWFTEAFRRNRLEEVKSVVDMLLATDPVGYMGLLRRDSRRGFPTSNSRHCSTHARDRRHLRPGDADRGGPLPGRPHPRSGAGRDRRQPSLQHRTGRCLQSRPGALPGRESALVSVGMTSTH